MISLGAGEIFAPFLIAVYVFLRHACYFVIIGTLVFGTVVYLSYLKYTKTYWKRRGISGPPTNLLFGNLLDMRRTSQIVDLEWTKRYGKVFGTYMFGTADLTISDLSMLRHVLLTDAASFIDRPQFLPYNSKDKTCLFQNSLNAKEGDDWREMRRHLTPAFTTGKIKNLIPLFNDCVLTFLEVLRNYSGNGKPVDLDLVNHRFTMDVISKAAFGVDINSQICEKNYFVEQAQRFFQPTIFGSVKILFLNLFPNVLTKFQQHTGAQIVFAQSHKFFMDILDSLYERRFKNKALSNTADFYEFILRSLSADHREAIGEQKDVSETKSYEKIEINAQAFLFLLAGFETTAFTLDAVFYMLALNPKAQETAREEALKVLKENTDVSYEQVAQLHYIDQVISESLRMYTAGPRMLRLCTQSTQVGDILIEKGTSITIPVNVINYDPEVFPDPHLFDPERFSSAEKAKRNPLANLSFGAGPRNCIGARFAQIEMKILIAMVLKHFKLTVRENAPRHPLKMSPGQFGKMGEKLMVYFEPV